MVALDFHRVGVRWTKEKDEKKDVCLPVRHCQHLIREPAWQKGEVGASQRGGGC